MYEFHPYFTNDGSVGLYNEAFNDIYHSAKGALTEAYEKFIYPLDFENILKKDKINVLDICYGIGYNSKSFLNYIFINFLKNKKYNSIPHIDKIDTHNFSTKDLRIYNSEIHNDNIFNKISVTAVDNDKFLCCLSPFIKTNLNMLTNSNINFKYKNIEKYIKINNFQKIDKNLKINKIINYLIFSKIFESNPDIYTNIDFVNLLFDEKFRQYFGNDLKGIFAYKIKCQGNNTLLQNNFTFLHNIYYKHLSNMYKKNLKRYKLQDFTFRTVFDDARNFILSDNNKYDIVFLDAFTPTKCPCLWSYEFLKQLYEVGFLVGNTYSKSEGAIVGTIASKSQAQIKYPLTKYDLGLIKSRAGIFYRDKNLIGQNEAIIALREKEVKSSTRISSSQYNKLHKR